MTNTDSQVIRHVKQYYPPTAANALVRVNSDYNDETYDERVQCIVVYNAAGEEIVPLPATAEKSRDDWENIRLPESEGIEPTANFRVAIPQ